MNKVFDTIRRKGTSGNDSEPQKDSPEGIAVQCVKAFCESGGSNGTGDEVTYLPSIVDAAESSPQAAAECAKLIRKYLKRDYWSKPSYQYNAIMLMRILADNPGPTFTRNMDQKFVDTTKEVLRSAPDLSVLQMLMETLNSYENHKSYDEGLALLLEMWRKEKERAQKHGGRQPQPPPQTYSGPPPVNPQADNFHSQNYFSRNHTNSRLPDPVELASRLEEARTSAKLLQEVVTNTPTSEVLNNDFMKEFADRCTSASRSIQGYMTAENPAPDNDTMESLIDTNEHLQAALSLHQRAMLQARKQAGIGAANEPNAIPALAPDHMTAPVSNGAGSSRRPSPHPTMDDSDEYEAPSMPPPKRKGKGKEVDYDSVASASASASRSHTPPAEDDPFRDPVPERSGAHAGGSGAGGSRYLDDEPRLAYEPFNPGFTTTQSYLGRQESAIGKEAMHGATAGGGHSSGTAKLSRVDSTEGEEGIYDVSPQRSKDPVYRY
ncbi:hypothetical protein PFICI_02809 [Pestalotiopsis fici W106-1]|uniref:GAT domain-containing protein n=1 Tax=Pestalotiopsis fici (strain W106-1 / CGMCC3.15140) TaxID=1229662 RepID=W3XFK8_PESFW|nr:uncharacterized protein PFICI_02809 [Pestalotiopsis fici W106-1]ETS84784.1 hypothetical protein PFICI_02809 [Pestalotiopsis fici W106-1]